MRTNTDIYHREIKSETTYRPIRETKTGIVSRTLQGFGECLPASNRLPFHQAIKPHTEMMKSRGTKVVAGIGLAALTILGLVYLNSEKKYIENTNVINTSESNPARNNFTQQNYFEITSRFRN